MSGVFVLSLTSNFYIYSNLSFFIYRRVCCNDIDKTSLTCIIIRDVNWQYIVHVVWVESTNKMVTSWHFRKLLLLLLLLLLLSLLWFCFCFVMLRVYEKIWVNKVCNNKVSDFEGKKCQRFDVVSYCFTPFYESTQICKDQFA